MVYDPEKKFDKDNKTEDKKTSKVKQAESKLGGLVEVKEEVADKDAEGDSIMEELDESKPPTLGFKKAKSMAPALHNLAASPNKDNASQSSLS